MAKSKIDDLKDSPADDGSWLPPASKKKLLKEIKDIERYTLYCLHATYLKRKEGRSMADFCKQCSNDLFGPEVKNDFIGLTTDEDKAQGLFAIVLCEGCGPIQVDVDGSCISSDCKIGHK